MKIGRNKELDVENSIKLKTLGWKVLTIFECELKNEKREITLNEISANIY